MLFKAILRGFNVLDISANIINVESEGFEPPDL